MLNFKKKIVTAIDELPVTVVSTNINGGLVGVLVHTDTKGDLFRYADAEGNLIRPQDSRTSTIKVKNLERQRWGYMNLYAGTGCRAGRTIPGKTIFRSEAKAERKGQANPDYIATVAVEWNELEAA